MIIISILRELRTDQQKDSSRVHFLSKLFSSQQSQNLFFLPFRSFWMSPHEIPRSRAFAFTSTQRTEVVVLLVFRPFNIDS
jgi:hypothetical protein